MKKILLLSFVALSSIASLSAKQLTFSQNGEAIAPGATVEFKDYEEFDMGAFTEVFIDPQIFITKDSSDPVTLRTTANFPIQVCIGGQCEAAESVLKENLQFAANTPTSLLLDCSVIFGQGESIDLPQIEVLIEAWYSSDSSSVTSMKLLMGDVAGANDITKNKNIVTVSGKTFTYSLDGQTTLEVFNLTGRCVSTKSLQGNGSVSIDNLTKGVYLYRLSGKVKSTGKFAVK